MTIYIATTLGFLLHFLGRYGEHWRAVGRTSPWVYVCGDPIGWAAALIGVAAGTILLPDLGPVVGLSPTPLGGFAVGYMGSSIAAKLPGLVAPKVAGTDQR